MTTFQDIEKAISIIETQRPYLDDGVADVSLAALREKLVDLQAQSAGEQYPEITVLVADLSGFTSMSELRDAEEVRDTMNAVWRKLDSVITSWGGKVDKHVGDAVIALFGVPKSREDDQERAIQAALDMQLELALFNEGSHQDAGQIRYSWSSPQAKLQMRIGIHAGPVFMGTVGSSKEQTAVGDTVNMANHLEKNAPVDGVLISDEVYQQVSNVFEVTFREPIEVEGRSQPAPVYVVVREKARPFYMSIRGIEGVQTRIVGRNDELETLQDVLQTVIDGSMAQVVTVLGHAGVGKSRLLYEYERLLTLQPEKFNILRGRAQREIGQRPYSLFRDLLAGHFDIHRRNSPAVAREKLVRGIREIMVEDAAQSRESAHLIGQLLGFDFSHSPYLQGILDDARLLRESAFKEMVSLLSAVATQHSAAVLLLEDLHRADEGTFDLLDYLVERCADVPLLIVCIARPSLLDRRASWQMVESLNEKTYQRIELPALNAIDSRHLAMGILQRVRQLPPRLLEMIVNRANGNPFFTEELVSLLIEFEAIVPVANRWRVELLNLPEMPLSPTLADMVRLRLNKLSELERMVLQKAAVSGRIFWDALLIEMVHEEAAEIPEDQILDTLFALEKNAWIYRRKLSTFADVQEYAFRHDSLSVAIYETISADSRQQVHKCEAKWLIERNGRQAENHAAVIAHHFAQANDLPHAAEWYHRAAVLAQNAYMPETAIDYFEHALRMLPSNKETAPQRIEINAGLGDMLQKQARFQAAISAFADMRTAALSVQNHKAELQAYRALMLAYGFQGELHTLLQVSKEAEKVARAMHSQEDVAYALALQSWAYLAAGHISQAVKPGRESLSVSTAAVARLEMAISHAVVANIGRVAARYDQAMRLIKRAQTLFRQEGERRWEALMLANLAYVAQAQMDDEEAEAYYLESLRIAQDIGDYFGAILTLRHLGRLAQRNDAFAKAQTYYQQALVFAEKSGNAIYRAGIAGELGQLYLHWSLLPEEAINIVDVEANIQQAYLWFERTAELGRACEQTMIVAQAFIGQSRLMLGDDELQEAIARLTEAIGLMDGVVEDAFNKHAAGLVLAVAWRTLALVMMQLPENRLPVTVHGKAVMPHDCLEKSVELLTQSKQKGRREKIKTLEIWADYEQAQGNALRQASLLREAAQLSQS